MIDRATHWFYARRHLSAGASVENMRHDLWANGFYNIWLTLKKSDPPYRVTGLWGQEKFEIEFEPRHFLTIRTLKENEWLKKAFARVLGQPPHFQYEDRAGVVYEWRVADREARWQSMQGLPAYKNLKRFDLPVEE